MTYKEVAEMLLAKAQFYYDAADYEWREGRIGGSASDFSKLRVTELHAAAVALESLAEEMGLR